MGIVRIDADARSPDSLTARLHAGRRSTRCSACTSTPSTTTATGAPGASSTPTRYRTDGAIDTPENVRDWDPVVVTVERPTGATTYALPFDEKNMCNQVSHGC